MTAPDNTYASSQGDEYDADDFFGDECGNCGGEGFTYNCIDGCCVDVEEGCDLCPSRCDWCNPRPPKKLPDNEVQALRQVLADALEQQRNSPPPTGANPPKGD